MATTEAALIAGIVQTIADHGEDADGMDRVSVALMVLGETLFGIECPHCRANAAMAIREDLQAMIKAALANADTAHAMRGDVQ